MQGQKVIYGSTVGHEEVTERSIGQQDHFIVAFINARVEATRLSVLLWSLSWLYDVVHQTTIGG